jgi:hypothetical protein
MLLARSLVARWLLTAGIALGASAVMSTWTMPDTDFFISAKTGVVNVDVTCGQQLVWDLPPGEIRALGESEAAQPMDGESSRQATTAPPPITVVLRGGAHVRLRAGADGKLRADFSGVNPFKCAESATKPPSTVEISVGNATLPYADDYAYRSLAASDGTASGALARKLLLRDRVVIGEPVQFGSGSMFGAESPILEEARIELRTTDLATDQRRLIAEEHIDAGGVIDSHACLDAAERRDGDVAGINHCLTQATRVGEGFVQWDGAAPMSVQYFVRGPRVGVQWQGSGERKLLVTRWAWLVSSTWAQMLALLIVFVPSMIQLHLALKPERTAVDRTGL